MRNTAYRLWFSDRGFPLIYCGSPLDVPVLTVENYCKWYQFYLAMPDGQVKQFYFEDDKFNDTTWSNHTINPAYYKHICSKFGFHEDDQAYEIIVGRWEIESLQNDKY